MITFEINRILNIQHQVKHLENGYKSILIRIKVALKSYKSNKRVDIQVQPDVYSEIVQKQNQLRAPP